MLYIFKFFSGFITFGVLVVFIKLACNMPRINSRIYFFDYRIIITSFPYVTYIIQNHFFSLLKGMLETRRASATNNYAITFLVVVIFLFTHFKHCNYKNCLIFHKITPHKILQNYQGKYTQADCRIQHRNQWQYDYFHARFYLCILDQ